MALSPAASVRRSAGSSAASLRQSNNSKGSGSGSASGYGSGSRDHGRRRTHDHHDQHGSISIDTLVNHLLSAKRSLSSITLVVRGHELATQARASHEDATILSAQTAFLRSSIMDQAALLVRVRRALQATYDWAKRDFDKLLKQMDDVDRRLEKTMSSLRTTVVDGLLRPRDEEAPKTLIDFVDEESVFGIRDQMKKSIQELQSFDGDLLRFDTDIRNLRKSFSDPNQSAEADFEPPVPWTDRLVVLNEHSSNMAHLLTSLTKHFDLCVTAIRATDGAAALARRKAAEATQIQGHESVSISGVIAEHEAQMSDLEPQTAGDRAEMLKVVVQDAGEVDDVVREIRERLAALEAEHDALEADCRGARQAYAVALGSHGALVEVGDRLGDYLAAEDDFRARWDLEKDAVFVKLREMQELREFYERYADAYDGLVLEARRRRAVDEKIAAVWRKAQDGVDKILLADQAEREGFRTDVGEFLPTDLWAGMQGPPRRYEVVPVPITTTTTTAPTAAINDGHGGGRRAGDDGL